MGLNFYLIMKFLTLTIMLLHPLLGGSLKYEDKKITSMLKEYFNASKTNIVLLGRQFFEDEDRTVFQIDIECDIKDINNAILFSFEVVTILSRISVTSFTHSILIIHFNSNTIPIVAEANILCSEKFFVKKIYNENKWRKNCLIIKNL